MQTRYRAELDALYTLGEPKWTAAIVLRTRGWTVLGRCSHLHFLQSFRPNRMQLPVCAVVSPLFRRCCPGLPLGGGIEHIPSRSPGGQFLWRLSDQVPCGNGLACEVFR